MALTLEMVADYLKKSPRLGLINNHDVKDDYGSKKNQTPLTIEFGKHCIEELLSTNEFESTLSAQEIEDLEELKNALEQLPSGISSTIYAVTTGFDAIQNNLFNAIKNYLNHLASPANHELLLKSIVLVLKILEYDLSKQSGPLILSLGFFASMQVLDEPQKIANHAVVSELLGTILVKYDPDFEENATLQSDHLLPMAG